MKNFHIWWNSKAFGWTCCHTSTGFSVHGCTTPSAALRYCIDQLYSFELSS